MTGTYKQRQKAQDADDEATTCDEYEENLDRARRNAKRHIQSKVALEEIKRAREKPTGAFFEDSHSYRCLTSSQISYKYNRYRTNINGQPRIRTSYMNHYTPTCYMNVQQERSQTPEKKRSVDMDSVLAQYRQLQATQVDEPVIQQSPEQLELSILQSEELRQQRISQLKRVLAMKTETATETQQPSSSVQLPAEPTGTPTSWTSVSR